MPNMVCLILFSVSIWYRDFYDFLCVRVSLCLWLQEKAMGNRPSEMMDREKAYIPELQTSFMEHIAMPIYK